MKIRFLIALMLFSCQGPWDYYPEDPPTYKGIWTSAYIISERPVSDACFDKMHNLEEARFPRFAFYDSASIKITGKFKVAGLSENPKDTAFYLTPNVAAQSPNCFIGAMNLRAIAGENYYLDIYFKWDSAGKTVESNFSANTYIPKKFEVKRAYDLDGVERHERDIFAYYPPPRDLQSHYFVPEYSGDVGGVLVSMSYCGDCDNVFWGENTFDEIMNQFSTETDTTSHAHFGDIEHVYFARNQKIAGTKKDIDSIPIISMVTPAKGNATFFFYATTPEYVTYRDTYQNNDDSRIKPIYNIQGGAGIFAGMLVDTFKAHFEPSSADVKLFSAKEALKAYCFRLEPENDEPFETTRKECSRFLMVTNRSEAYKWCELNDFPIKKYLSLSSNEIVYCGSALVHYAKIKDRNSAILDREVAKWCEEHPTDRECE